MLVRANRVFDDVDNSFSTLQRVVERIHFVFHPRCMALGRHQLRSDHSCECPPCGCTVSGYMSGYMSACTRVWVCLAMCASVLRRRVWECGGAVAYNLKLGVLSKKK